MTAGVRVEFVTLPHGEGLAPAYASADAAGLDLPAAVPQDAPVTLLPWKSAAIPTGIALALPKGFEGQIRPRSGLAARDGITVLNAPGTIDADYRGEVKVLLINLSDGAFTLRRGERIAQLVLARVDRADLIRVDALGDTPRGDGGFGSTGR